MIKNKKAQVMALDVLFSVVLIILMFFLLFNIVEVRVYEIARDVNNKNLDKVGHLAFLQIINNPNLNCYAKDTSNSFTIPACVSLNNTKITKKNLGVPTNYKCVLERKDGGINFSTNECNDIFVDANINSYFSIDFNVAISTDLDFTKENYKASYKGINNNFSNIVEFNLKVWEDEN